MAGRGPAPKPAHLRQRRNRASTQATLPSEAASADRKVPDLPEREGGWHPMALDWWASVWTSPMAAEFLNADRHGLYLLAELHQRRWLAVSDAQIVRLSAEIRQHEIRFGLSPIDRRRLQWQVEKSENPQENTSTGSKGGRSDRDPRKTLKTI